MSKKTLLILVDGMRPDSLAASQSPVFASLLRSTRYTLNARTVMPSVTLPCHMSLFHSVTPDRHGILTNTWTPQVRPIAGLFEVLHASGKRTSLFANWEELRDLARPGSLSQTYIHSMYDYPQSDRHLARAAIGFANEFSPDFMFLYLGETDEIGHRHGWMSQEYLSTLRAAGECIEQVLHALRDEYTVFITADHGGHARSHGTDLPEDMTIPLIVQGADFPVGEFSSPVSILDIAPTIAALMQITPPADWEGRSLL